MTGYAGLTAGRKLTAENRELLEQYLSPSFVKQMENVPDGTGEMSAEDAAVKTAGCPAADRTVSFREHPEKLPHIQFSKAKKLPDGTVIPSVPMAVPVEEGGIFEALWNLAEMAGTGLNVRLADIPVRQETIEVCEILDRNPYQLESGCMLYLADSGYGCPGRVIGQTNRTKGRTVTGAEGTRYLDKPRHDR